VLSAGGGPALGIPARCPANIVEHYRGRVEFSHRCDLTRITTTVTSMNTVVTTNIVTITTTVSVTTN
jgi:hypothetical protein